MSKQLVISDLQFKRTSVPFPEEILVVWVDKWQVISCGFSCENILRIEIWREWTDPDMRKMIRYRQGDILREILIESYAEDLILHMHTLKPSDSRMSK